MRDRTEGEREGERGREKKEQTRQRNFSLSAFLVPLFDRNSPQRFRVYIPATSGDFFKVVVKLIPSLILWDIHVWPKRRKKIASDSLWWSITSKRSSGSERWNKVLKRKSWGIYYRGGSYKTDRFNKKEERMELEGSESWFLFFSR